MIDIFLNEGPHFMETFSFWDLAYGCLEEIGKFSVALLLSMGLFLAARRIRQKSLRTAIFLLMPAVQLLYVWTVSIRSEFFFSFMFALMLTLVFRVLELIPLTGAGYLFLFSALLFPSRLFNSTSVILGHLWLFWVIFCACYLAAKLDLGHLHGNHFSCYVLFTVLSLLGYTVYLAMSFLMPHLEELLQTYSADGSIPPTGLCHPSTVPVKTLAAQPVWAPVSEGRGIFPMVFCPDPWRLYSGRPPLHGDVVSKSAGAAPVPLPLHHPAWPSDPIPVPAVSGRLL